MDNLKWGDVAHYYSASGISIERTPYDIDQFVTGNVTINEGTHVVQSLSVGGHCVFLYDDNLEARGVVTADKYKPILRHYEEMTESEDTECMLVHTRWVEDEDLRRVIWDLAKQHKTFDQYSTHWLISRGFDVFGLIESGQAIRKELSND